MAHSYTSAGHASKWHVGMIRTVCNDHAALFTFTIPSIVTVSTRFGGHKFAINESFPCSFFVVWGNDERLGCATFNFCNKGMIMKRVMTRQTFHKPALYADDTLHQIQMYYMRAR